MPLDDDREDLSDSDDNDSIDVVTNYQKWIASGGVEPTNHLGRTYSNDTSRIWSAVKAVEDDGEFSMLTEGQRNKDGKIKVAYVYQEGVISGATSSPNGNKMYD